MGGLDCSERRVCPPLDLPVDRSDVADVSPKCLRRGFEFRHPVGQCLYLALDVVDAVGDVSRGGECREVVVSVS